MGGCGVLLHHSARVLLAQGHEVLFLLDLDDKSFQQFDQVDRLHLPNPQNCRAYQVSTLVQGHNILPYTFISYYEYKAYQFYVAARQLYNLEQPEVIEFFEYCGVAYHALSAKIAGLDFAAAHLTVRLHTSLELIDRQQSSLIQGIDRYIMYGLEHQSMRLAETVLYPSKAYLEKAYLDYYGPWFGDRIHSQPAILDYPVSTGAPDSPNGILFYGRLFGNKGADRFVDAAVLYLSNPRNPRRLFYLVGYDSHQPPNAHGSYREYLLSKIPHGLRDSFIFMGQISWQRLGELLPKILFGVVPSFQESFCYAAHELYETGIPLIVTNIPAFEDYFYHGINALVFDGTVSDLAEKISLLSTDESLRRKISRPYPVTDQPLGDFYTHLPTKTWIQTEAPPAPASLLVCILVDDPKDLDRTLHSLQTAVVDDMHIVLMHPVRKEKATHTKSVGAAVWFLGRLYAPQDESGTPVNPTEILTTETLLILKAGDLLQPDYLPRSLMVLQRQPQIAFVGSWKQVKKGFGVRLAALPLDAVSEIAPYIQSSPFSRFVMRTRPNRLLIDLFDPRAGRLGELKYLWQLETENSSGLVIPLPLVSRSDKPEPILGHPALDYIILQDDTPFRKARLARFNLSLANRARVLRHFQYELDFSHPLMYKMHRVKYRIATSRFSKWMDRLPWIKKAMRLSVEGIYSIISSVHSAARGKL